MPEEGRPFSFIRWMMTALRRFLVRLITAMGGLTAFNYAYGLDDAYKQWASSDPYVVSIFIGIGLVTSFMYDWEWSKEP